jgi:Na+-translocating ferredoxin:NAD+ oxidoreductase RnfD subunit
MHNEDPTSRDPLLAQLFAEQDQTLPAADFTANIMARVHAEQRKQRLRSWISVALMIAVAALLAPVAIDFAATISSYLDLGLSTAMAALNSGAAQTQTDPLITYLVGGVFACIAGPLLYAWRQWRR